MTSELKKFLTVGAAAPVAAPRAGDSVRKAEFNQSTGTIEVPVDAPEGEALAFLEAAGQDPAEWEVTGFRRSEWGREPETLSPDDEGDMRVSTRFTFKRRDAGALQPVDLDDLLALIHADNDLGRELVPLSGGTEAAALHIGDMQFGQVGPEGDPFEAVENTLQAIDRAAEQLERRGGTGTLLVSWLGDHVEGFTSQKGKNTWRTRLTLSEQIRATRRVMYYAVERLAPLCDQLIMAAVPGNHGRVEAANGSTTRVDDNHDVEALNAVAEALSMSDRYGNVQCVVPQEDELSLAVTVGGFTWGLVHGDIWKTPGKHWAWFKEQVFHGGPVAAADGLACGHFHHLRVEEDGLRLFVQVPTLGPDGTYWRHIHGTAPHPGAVLVFTEGKEATDVIPIRV